MRLRFGSAPAVLGLSSLVLAACGARTSLDLPGNSGGAGGATVTSTTVTSTHSTTTGKTTVVTGTTTSATTSSGLTGPVISVSGTIFDAETSVAIDPASKRLASAWIAVTSQGGSNIGFAFSSDGGANWTAPDQVPAPNGRDSSDPVVAVDASGAFYVSFVAFHRDAQGQPIDMHVYVAKAPAGSNSFGPPVEVTDSTVSDPFYDKPWIVVTKAGTIAVSYADIENTGNSEAIALSTDGVNWTRSHIAGPSQSQFFNLNYLCPDATTKRLHAAFVSTDQSAVINISIAHSDDEGHTWSALQTIAGQSTSGEQVSFDDPTCFAQGGKLLVAYGIANTPPPPDESNAQSSFAIRLAELDGNGSGSVTKRMDLQDPASGKVFQHPTIAGDESGRLAIVYYAAAVDEDLNGSYRIGSLGNTGNISVHPTQAYVDPIFATVARSSTQWLGDYTGLVVDNGTAYTTFVTNQSAPASEIAFTKMTLP
jgi:hypothetical protein